MSLDADPALDALTLVIEAVRDSAKLQAWFQNLARMSQDARQQAILQTTQDMRSHRESEELVTAFGLLAYPHLFEAVSSALRDCDFTKYRPLRFDGSGASCE
jgi:hypothetical protein